MDAAAGLPVPSDAPRTAAHPRLALGWVVTLFLTVGALLAPSGASGAATPFSIKNFSPGGSDLASDRAGNVWFTVQRPPDPADIVRLTPTGQRTSFPIPAAPGEARPQRVDVLTTEPDGTVWFQEGGAFGTISPTGTVAFLPSQSSRPTDVGAEGVIGSDGNLWFAMADAGRIGRVSPAGDVKVFRLARGRFPSSIALGADGNVWFNDFSGSSVGRVGRITPDGAIREFKLRRETEEGVFDLATGPDGNVWFTTRIDGKGWIGRISRTGKIRLFKTTADNTSRITAGPDGKLWFTARTVRRGFQNGALGRITTSGKSRIYALTSGRKRSLGQIVTGGNGTMWFTQSGTTQVVSRLTLRRASRARAVAAAARRSVYKSEGCGQRVDRYDTSTWACTTLRTPGEAVASGGTATVTFHFRIRRTMKNVRVCFSHINGSTDRGCAYKRTYRQLKRGRVIERTMTLSVPDVTKSGGYYVDNRSKLLSSGRGWPADGRVCIVAPGQPAVECHSRQ